MNDRGTQDEILTRIVDRLRAKIPDFSDMACFLSDQPTPLIWPDGEVCCSVSVSDGRFPESFSTGGGVSTLCKSITLDITVWVRCNLDALPSFDTVLNQDRGLWSTWEPAVLRAMLLDEDDVGNPIAWMPTGADGRGLLRNQIAAMRTTAPRPDPTGEWLGMTISFGIDFDWRL